MVLKTKERPWHSFEELESPESVVQAFTAAFLEQAILSWARVKSPREMQSSMLTFS